MRTTIDIPHDALRVAKMVANHRGVSLGTVIGDLIEERLARVRENAVEISVTGLPVVRVGRPVTAAEVAEHDKD